MANPLLCTTKERNFVKYFYQLLIGRLVGQSLAALIATTLQNLSTSRRCHSLTEAVNFALLSLFGLECSFHNTFSCIWFFSFSFFGGFRRFLRVNPVYTHDNFIIISQKRKVRQAILCVFSFSFLLLWKILPSLTKKPIIDCWYERAKSNIDCRLLRHFQGWRER